jgi:hypothetical protein
MWRVPIYFFDLLDDDGWEPIRANPADPTYYWNDGGFMTTAPVDIAATFDGAMWQSTKVEPAFKWRGRRIRPNFAIPKRHHNLRQLVILVGGEMAVAYGDHGEETQVISPDEFWVAEAGVPYTITSGDKGATYLESWGEAAAASQRPEVLVGDVPPGVSSGLADMSVLETYWHDDPNWIRR